jgi:hypothetical protein
MILAMSGPSAEWQQKHRQRRVIAVLAFLREHPCVDCGEADPIVLDFDHVRGTKRMKISRMLSGTYSLKAIFEEIEKCEVRCANCHRRITASRGGFRAFADVAPELLLTPRIQPRFPHGTRAAYQRGCRCDPCRKAQAAAVVNYKKYGSYKEPRAG